MSKYEPVRIPLESLNGQGLEYDFDPYEGEPILLGRTGYRYDGGTNMQELYSNGAAHTELVRAGGPGGGIGSVLYTDQSIAPGSTGPVEHFLYNAVGHTVALTDAAGTVTQTSLYEAFGGTVVKSGTSSNNRLANTKERDAKTGLDNHGFRYYDPATGRYISRDPIGYGDGRTTSIRWGCATSGVTYA